MASQLADKQAYETDCIGKLSTRKAVEQVSLKNAIFIPALKKLSSDGFTDTFIANSKKHQRASAFRTVLWQWAPLARDIYRPRRTLIFFLSRLITSSFVFAVTPAKQQLHLELEEIQNQLLLLLAAMSPLGWSHQLTPWPSWCHRAELLISTRRVPFVLISNPRPNFLDLAFPMAVSPGNVS